MTNRITTNLRKWVSLIIAVLAYYLIHEGSHLIYALGIGTFKGVKFMGLGVQIACDDRAMTNLQLAVFCILGSIATLIAGYILVLSAGKLTTVKNKHIKAIGYYTTLVMLLLDPIYLSVLYRFFGGGDMNGIKLFGVPEIVCSLIYGAMGIVNLVVFIKLVYPKNKMAFAR